MNNDDKYTGIRLKVSWRNRLKIIAAKEHRGIAEMIMWWIEQYEKEEEFRRSLNG